MMVRPADEESEAEVRRVDQDNINKFARLNARLHELRDERSVIKVCLSLSCFKLEYPSSNSALNFVI